MSEEEILEKIEKIIKHFESQEYILNGQKIYKYIQGLLDLYNKQKEKNEEGYKQLQIDTAEEVLKWKGKYHLLSRKIDVVSKDKIRDKIKELEKKKNCGNSIVFWEISSQIDLLKELLEEE